MQDNAEKPSSDVQRGGSLKGSLGQRLLLAACVGRLGGSSIQP